MPDANEVVTSAASGDAQSGSELKRGHARCERSLGGELEPSPRCPTMLHARLSSSASHNAPPLSLAPAWLLVWSNLIWRVARRVTCAYYLWHQRRVATRASGCPPGLKPLSHRSQSVFQRRFLVAIFFFKADLECLALNRYSSRGYPGICVLIDNHNSLGAVQRDLKASSTPCSCRVLGNYETRQETQDGLLFKAGPYCLAG